MTEECKCLYVYMMHMLKRLNVYTAFITFGNTAEAVNLTPIGSKTSPV